MKCKDCPAYWEVVPVFESYPDMIEQDLHEILEAVAFTDRIIFGRTNYSKIANSYKGHKHYYNECAAEVVSFCQERGIDYHIKKKTITEE